MEAIYGSRVQAIPYVKVKKEYIEIEDNDHLLLEWTDIHSTQSEEEPQKNKIAIIFGCINGANNCRYAQYPN